jgi:hypothetical protein
MPSSTNQVTPEERTKNTSRDWRPGVSQKTSVVRSGFAPLTIEEKMTYRKWRRATVLFYGAFFFVVAVLSIAIGPADTSTSVNNKGAYPAIASAGYRSPH